MLNQVKILYVDDEHLNLMLFDAMFKSRYRVLLAESGELGLSLLTENPDVRVVISDMRMPGMTGLEFIKKAKQQHPGMLFYILTGYEITPDIQQSLKDCLIEDYFQKPFDLDEIDESISRRMAKQ